MSGLPLCGAGVSSRGVLGGKASAGQRRGNVLSVCILPGQTWIPFVLVKALRNQRELPLNKSAILTTTRVVRPPTVSGHYKERETLYNSSAIP